MKQEKTEDEDIFYMELPQTDYLTDIEIQDEIDSNEYDSIQGLSRDQVNQIARDSLDNLPSYYANEKNDEINSNTSDQSNS